MGARADAVSDYDIADLVDNLNSPDFRRNPYPYYRRMREHAPLYQAADRWILTRHNDCFTALRDHRWTQVPEDLTMCLPDRHASPDQQQKKKPYDLRAFLTAEFSPGRLHWFEPRVQELVDGLVDRLLELDEVDFIAAFARPVTGFVGCELFGVPQADRELFSGWVEAIVRRVDIAASVSAEEVDAHDQARAQFRAYFRELVAERRRNPTDDMLSSVIRFADEAGTMSESDFLDACIFILIAGHRAPMETIGLGTLALASHPDERARLRSDPAIAATAVEELLRYDGPAQIAPRMVLEDVELYGQTIREGDIALLMLGAANRDPDVFDEPDQLDLTRRPNPHLTFGQGRHYCAGAPVGRLVLRTAFTTLLRKAPDFQIAGDPLWTKNIFLRGLAALPVAMR